MQFLADCIINIGKITMQCLSEVNHFSKKGKYVQHRQETQLNLLIIIDIFSVDGSEGTYTNKLH